MYWGIYRFRGPKGTFRPKRSPLGPQDDQLIVELEIYTWAHFAQQGQQMSLKVLVLLKV